MQFLFVNNIKVLYLVPAMYLFLNEEIICNLKENIKNLAIKFNWNQDLKSKILDVCITELKTQKIFKG